jgi:hypothetical protein
VKWCRGGDARSSREQMVWNGVWGGVRGRVWNRWYGIVYGMECEVVYETGALTRPRIPSHKRFHTTCSIHDLAHHPIHDSTPSVPYSTSHLTPYTISHHLFHTRPRTPPHLRFHTICSIHDLASHPYTRFDQICSLHDIAPHPHTRIRSIRVWGWGAMSCREQMWSNRVYG